MNRTKIYYFNILVLMLLSVFIFASCKNDAEYSLIYSTQGNGYIECNYDVGATIKHGTSVKLKAITLENDELFEWYINGEPFSKKESINVKIKSDIVIEAVFTGISYKDKTYDKYSDYDTNGEKRYCVKVLAAFDDGYLTTDGTDYRIIYTEEPFVFSTGDVLIHYMAYAGYSEFTISLYKVDKVKLTSNLVKLSDALIQSGNIMGTYVEATGRISNENQFYAINLLNSNYRLLLHTPDKDVFDVDEYINRVVTFKGYLYGLFDNYTIHFMMNEWHLNSDLNDIEDDPIISPSNGKIADEDLSNINAIFESNWTNVKIVINDSQTYNMTKKDGYYTYNYSNYIKTVSFKSGTMSTETFTIDTDRRVFICQEKRFNNLYSGYFTRVSELENSVVKVSALSINDLHGYITQTGIDKGGISNTLYLIDSIRNENNIDDVLLGANGDMFQGTAISNLTYGRSVIEAMNMMDFDFMGIGNHEFDWGIEKVFSYFDQLEENGEANFPLLNSNIVYSANNELVLFDGYNILDSLMVTKNGLQIGIISCIGQLKSSILYTRVCDYEFKDVSEVAIPLANTLRDAGADIIVVNIHGGNSSGVSDYSDNQALVNAKYNNNPLIDLVINGHTHTNQVGYINRNGADLAILQASSYNYYLGEYEIYYDTVEERVTSINVNTYNINSTGGSNYDSELQKVVDENYKKVQDQIDEVYCVAGTTISSKSDLYNWGANVIRASVGAQIGISNTGGIRSTGNIKRGNNICLENMYLINPFDNEIVLCKMPARTIAAYLNRNTTIYYTMESSLDLNRMASSNEMVTIAVIDYVFYGGYFPTNCEFENTGIVFRDAMIEDLRLRDTFNPNNDSSAKIGNLYIN